MGKYRNVSSLLQWKVVLMLGLLYGTLVPAVAQNDEVVYYEPVEFVGKYKPRWWSVVIDSSLFGYKPKKQQNFINNGTRHVFMQSFYYLSPGPLRRLIVEHEGYLYTAFTTYVEGYPDGYLLEKRDMASGEVVWQAKYDARFGKYFELPIRIFIHDGALHLACIRGTDTTDLEFLYVFFRGKPAVWSLRHFDLETGRLLCHHYPEKPAYTLWSDHYRSSLYSIFYSRREGRYIAVHRGYDTIRGDISKGEYYSICRLTRSMDIYHCDTLRLPFVDTFGLNVLHDIKEVEGGYVGVDVKVFYRQEKTQAEGVMWLFDESFKLKREIDLSEHLRYYTVSSNFERGRASNYYEGSIMLDIPIYDTIDGELCTSLILQIDTNGNVLSKIFSPSTKNSSTKRYDFYPHSNWGSRVLMYKIVGKQSEYYASEFAFVSDSFLVVTDTAEGAVTFAIDREEWALRSYPGMYTITSTGDLINVFAVGYPSKDRPGTFILLAAIVTYIPKEVLQMPVHTEEPQYQWATGIALYPNPATGSWIEIVGGEDPVQWVWCTDEMGRHRVLRVSSGRIDISDLPEGMYYLQLYDRSGQLRGVKPFVRLRER